MLDNLLAYFWSSSVLQGFNWIDTDAMIYAIIGLILIDRPLWVALFTCLCVMTKQNIGLGMAVGTIAFYVTQKRYKDIISYSAMLSILVGLSVFIFYWMLDKSFMYWTFERAKERIGNPIWKEIWMSYFRPDNNMLKIITLLNLLLVWKYPVLIYGLCVLICSGLGRCGVDFSTHSILAVYLPLVILCKRGYYGKNS